ncbi:MAG: DNA recombination protein RmuC [Succinivibrio sp.]|nr:DNA recombination protein RmuC [Succinivibrio sp.]
MVNQLRELTLEFTDLDLALSGTVIFLLALLLTLYLRYLKKSRDSALLKSDNEQQHLQNAQLDNELQGVRTELESIRGDNVVLREEKASLGSTVSSLQGLLAEHKSELELLQRSKSDLIAENSSLKSRIDGMSQLREEDQRRFEESAKDLENRLTVLGERMLRKRGEELQQLSREQFRQTMDPLTKELNIFREQLNKSQKNSSEQAGALSAELKLLQQSQQALSRQAQELTLALSSGGKTQGMWGELQLERVLDASGLTQGIEYEREVAGKRADGEYGRPDAIIRLPQNHCLIIDAKCAITAYTSYVNATDDKEREEAMKQHTAALKRHIDGLSKRDYVSYSSFNSPSFVFMFVPVDGALTSALMYDHDLYDYASRRGIYLVSPSTIIPALRVVANLWVISRQNERVRSLAEEAQRVYDKFNLVRDAFQDVLNKKESFERSLNDFQGRLLSGRGNLEKMLKNFAVKAPGVIAELDRQSAQMPEITRGVVLKHEEQDQAENTPALPSALEPTLLTEVEAEDEL